MKSPTAVDASFPSCNSPGQICDDAVCIFSFAFPGFGLGFSSTAPTTREDHRRLPANFKSALLRQNSWGCFVAGSVPCQKHSFVHWTLWRYFLTAIDLNNFFITARKGLSEAILLKQSWATGALNGGIIQGLWYEVFATNKPKMMLHSLMTPRVPNQRLSNRGVGGRNKHAHAHFFVRIPPLKQTGFQRRSSAAPSETRAGARLRHPRHY